MGEGEVHVVAAEEDVIADGDTRELERALLLHRGDGGEVGGASADVDDEDHVAHLEVTAPVLTARGDPGVERGLRLFEQGQVLEAGGVWHCEMDAGVLTEGETEEMARVVDGILG